MQIVRYTPDKAQEWDEFIKSSRNGTFLFLRGYMDYHSDRFSDHSLMYYSDKGKLITVMPANEKDDLLYSHQGLTYGGFVFLPKVHISEVGEMFDITIRYLKENGFSEWYYKQMPTVYHKIPSEEDSYWLWRHNASITECNMMSAVKLNKSINIVSSRKHTYSNKLHRQGYKVNLDASPQLFWPILENNLQETYKTNPVHTLQEITLLQERFPENIVCCIVENSNDEILAGTLLFITDRIIRTQYISATHDGKQKNALDFLMLSLIEHYNKNPQYEYFEFGTSMAEDSVHLNDGLILQKEGFGGRSIACRTYKIVL